MPVEPEQIIRNEERIITLEILIERIVNQGQVDQEDLEEARQQAAEQLAEKYEEVEVNN